MTSPLEHAEQAAVIDYCDRIGHDAALIYAIPNAGKRSIGAALYERAAGLKSGVPDLCLPVPMGAYHALYIEMKRADGKMSDVSDNQRRWIDALKSKGNAVAVCFGADEAIAVIKDYLKI